MGKSPYFNNSKIYIQITPRLRQLTFCTNSRLQKGFRLETQITNIEILQNRYMNTIKRLSTIALVFAALTMTACTGETSLTGSKTDNVSYFLSDSGTARFNDDFIQDIADNSAAPLFQLNSIGNIFNGSTLRIEYDLCGEPRLAIYEDTSESVQLCHELAENIYTELANENSIEAAYLASFVVLNYLTFHEIAHSAFEKGILINSENEEFNADAFAVVLSAVANQHNAPIITTAWLTTMLTGANHSYRNKELGRARNVACWWLGSLDQLALTTAQQELAISFANGGRDCAGEYSSRYQYVSSLIPDLGDIQQVNPLPELNAIDADFLETLTIKATKSLEFETKLIET